MNTRTIFIAVSLISVLPFSLWGGNDKAGRPENSCVGLHVVKKCRSVDSCNISDCSKGEYCITPVSPKSAAKQAVQGAQCVKPDAIGETTCADPGSQKIELVVKGITVPALEKCPALKPICFLGKCLASGEAVCVDSDGTNYAKLLKWNQAGNKQNLSSDISVLKSGKVTISTAADPAGAKVYPDKCKGPAYLLEQACDGGVAKEVGINCGEAKGCLNPGADGLCNGFTWSVPDGICKMDKIGNSNDLAARCGFKDTDDDGISDSNDNCVDIANQDQKDSDGDKVGNVCDNCPYTYNAAQFDVNADEIGDICQSNTITAGSGFTCARTLNGTVKCWGSNVSGEMGNGSEQGFFLVPTQVVELDKVISVKAGSSHACAVVNDGTVKCWGNNYYGQIGDGITGDEKHTPVEVSGLKGVIAIAAGVFHSCALISDGSVKCWGVNWSGQLGDGTKIDKAIPAPVPNLTEVTSIIAGYAHTCALISGGNVKCWGGNSSQLGNGVFGGSLAPVDVKDLSEVEKLASSGHHVCALIKDGTVKCWGENGSGQLGNGKTGDSNIPVSVKGISNAVAIFAGSVQSCAILEGGTIKCWGNNSFGQLDNDLAGFSVMNLGGGAIDMACGIIHTCAVLKDGSTMCWGFNGSGELGNGTTEYSPTPVEVKF